MVNMHDTVKFNAKTRAHACRVSQQRVHIPLEIHIYR